MKSQANSAPNFQESPSNAAALDEECLEYFDDAHHDTFFKTLNNFYEEKRFCDISIKVGDEIFCAHRIVLACTSGYFNAMFNSNMRESHCEVVEIKDILPSTLKCLIDFCYTSKIVITTQNVQSISYASSILQMSSVANKCCDFLSKQLQPDNCIGIREFADSHALSKLKLAADIYILSNFIQVAASDEFLSMSSNLLLLLISSDYIKVKSETEIFDAVKLWVEHEKESRVKFLSELIQQLRLPCMELPFLLEEVNPFIRNDPPSRSYFDKVLNFKVTEQGSAPFKKSSDILLSSRPRKSYSGTIFCVGGRGTSGDPFRSTECYNVLEDNWFPISEMSTQRRHVGLIGFKDKVYAIGGHDGKFHLKTGEMFDAKTNKWIKICPMAKARRGIAVAVLGDVLFAIGGLDSQICFSIVERYDAQHNEWSLASPMCTERGGVAAVSLHTNLYAIGGNDGNSSLLTCEKYDIYLNRWYPIEPMKFRRAGAGLAIINNCIYVVGGFDDNIPLNTIEMYDPVSNTWQERAKMNSARGGVGVAAIGGKIVAVGGHDGKTYLNSVEAYDPIADRWEPIAKIKEERAGAGVAWCQCSIDDIKNNTKNSKVFSMVSEYV